MEYCDTTFRTQPLVEFTSSDSQIATKKDLVKGEPYFLGEQACPDVDQRHSATAMVRPEQLPPLEQCKLLLLLPLEASIALALRFHCCLQKVAGSCHALERESMCCLLMIA
jgi:hypothetical protein